MLLVHFSLEMEHTDTQDGMRTQRTYMKWAEIKYDGEKKKIAFVQLKRWKICRKVRISIGLEQHEKKN